ncbi:DNA polymerase II large subunit [Candidatus Parvarchaeota archaeon]|nr:DNA polymerase II large subunit [Candidatus Parvarchaeota archaeon]
MVQASVQMQQYFEGLKAGLDKALAVARQAREKGLDPSTSVEITPAADVAGRVEGLIGPPGISILIRELDKSGMSRDLIAFEIVKKIVLGQVINGPTEKLIDLAVRVGVGILTEGVLVAPTEGISKIRVRSHPGEGSYLSVYFSGPIRSAGGTVAAQAVVLADVARRIAGIPDYKPTESEIERTVEEIEIYDSRCAHLQYKPSREDIVHILQNCPVCVDGDPTEEIEVSLHKNLPRVETNRVRGGIALVLCEGIAQKSAKVLKYTRKIKVDWNWLESIVKVSRKEGAFELKPLPGYLDELVAGRPIFSYPSRPGGFRLRYGRSRASGIMGKAIHPAAMYLLDQFIASGTQLKVERPGKGCVVSPCDTIEGPVVKLHSGDVVKVRSLKQAQALYQSVSQILFLGDMLVSLGDFLKSNHPLVQPAWCPEYFDALCKSAGLALPKFSCFEDALKFSRQTGMPLHPDYVYPYDDLTFQELSSVARWLASGKFESDWLKPKCFVLEATDSKSLLEKLCVEHKVEKGTIVLEPEIAKAVLATFGVPKQHLLQINQQQPSKNGFEERLNDYLATAQSASLKPKCSEFLSKLIGVTIKPHSPTYVGTRMGRPEKGREREMKPPVHVLFPIGHAEKNRSIMRLYRKMASQKYEGKGLFVEIANLACPKCKTSGTRPLCTTCGEQTVNISYCKKCNLSGVSGQCAKCGQPTHYGQLRTINLAELVEAAQKRVGTHQGVGAVEFEQKNWQDNETGADVRGVQGLISKSKIPEAIEKGFLRSKHGITIFRDGTCRFDATNVPMTHFKPCEIHVGIENLAALGYTNDFKGDKLVKDSQIVELKPQDIIITMEGAAYFQKVAQFIDDELVTLYNLPPFYNVFCKEDLLGKLAIGLSPHTSAGVLCRIVGFTSTHVGFGHPYFHTAKRRNCDGDEDSVSLLLDSLINFSKEFLPSSRGGTMDAPLVLTTVLDPNEVDDESHSMEICSEFDQSFYELAEKFSSPAEAKVRLVKNVLGTQAQYEGLGFTHDTSSIEDGVVSTTYIKFKSMSEKVDSQMRLEKKLRCVDPQDAAARILSSHFLPDIYGNLRKFSQQKFRCVDCNESFRRVPLIGKCSRCGGKILLTINKGGIEKYLKISTKLAFDFELPIYVKQRLELVKRDIDSIFLDEKSRQVGLSDFM